MMQKLPFMLLETYGFWTLGKLGKLKAREPRFLWQNYEKTTNEKREFREENVK